MAKHKIIVQPETLNNDDVKTLSLSRTEGSELRNIALEDAEGLKEALETYPNLTRLTATTLSIY